MSTILSLDPGGTTGYAIFDVQQDEFPELIMRGQIAGSLKGFIDFVDDVLSDIAIDAIVCESFTLREGVYGADLSPVYIIGALEGMYGKLIPIKYQEPKIKPLCDDNRLKKMGLHIPGKPHANDAVRHFVISMRNSKHMPTLEAGWKD
jgi:hypothetical protein